MVRTRGVAAPGIPPARAPRRMPTVTGRMRRRADGVPVVTYRRTFRLSPDEVWAWLSDRERQRSWLGEWRTAVDGRHMFRFSADDAEAPEFGFRVGVSDPGRFVSLAMVDDDGLEHWDLQVRLVPSSEVPGGTDLVAEQAMTDQVMAPSVGATCEFFWDRLVLVAHGEDASRLDFDEYFLAQAPGYRSMFPLQRSPQALVADD
jgi:uncharacterized protein YndB with AHSA1/START domain